MMNMMNCEQALQLAGATTLSGAVLAARHHVRTCPHCQRALSRLSTELTLLNERVALEQLLAIDLSDAVCRQGECVTTWVVPGTSALLAAAVQLGQQAPPSTAATVARLGAEESENASAASVIRQDEAVTDDGAVGWRVRFIIDSSSPDRCLADMQVDLYDRWNLSGIDVVLDWQQDRRRGQTDIRGMVQLSDIPVAMLNQMRIIICPPQAPTTT